MKWRVTYAVDPNDKDQVEFGEGLQEDYEGGGFSFEGGCLVRIDNHGHLVFAIPAGQWTHVFVIDDSPSSDDYNS